MANIWLDRENVVSMPPQSGKKNGLGLLSANSATKLSTKKNVLGNINNTIHNKQSTTTPFHGGRPLKPDIFASATKTLYNDVLRNQQRKQNFREAQKSLEKNIRPLAATVPVPIANKLSLPVDGDDDLFYYMDFPQAFCAKNCQKTLSEIWSESQTFEDGTIMQLVKSFPESNDLDSDDTAYKRNELKSDSYAIAEDENDDHFGELEMLLKYAPDNEDDFDTSNTPPLPDLEFSF